MEDYAEELLKKIKSLHDTVWEHRTPRPLIDDWLDNFTPDAPGQLHSEHLHALYLLSHFMYFGAREMRELLRSLFRDIYRYPLIKAIRTANGDTTDEQFIHTEFEKRLYATRFLGMGNPSESGCHLLYYFRQENCLPKDLFIHSHQMTRRSGSPPTVAIRFPDVVQYIFLDDFCGSGEQAKTYSDDVLQELKSVRSTVKVSYYTLFGTQAGLDSILANTLFDEVKAIYVLDDSYRCFSSQSRYFDGASPHIDKTFAEQMCRKYGLLLCPLDPLGFSDGQTLIGFHHNTPDNSLPIIWYNDPDLQAWVAIFRRYPKNYEWTAHES